MQTLTYGFKKPETNDRGPTVFPALEANIQQLNDHNHDGANSAKLTSASIVSVPQIILAADWVSDGGGNFHQNVSMLPGYDYDQVTISFRDPSGSYIYPTVTRISSIIVRVTTNDSASAMTLIYGV